MPSVFLTYSAEDFRTDPTTGETAATDEQYALEFDAVVSERAVFGAVLTEHAVEGGAAMSDHKIPKLRAYSLTCVVSQHPLGSAPRSGSRTQSVTANPEPIDLGGGTKVVGLVYSQDVTRVADVLAELADLAERSVLVTVQTDLRLYENMEVIDVSAPRTVKDGDAIEFAIALQEVRTASVETTTAPEPRLPRNRREVDRGGQSTESASGVQNAALQRSVLSRLLR
jgi:hypothetical protein